MQSVIEKFQTLIESRRSEILEKTRQIKELETEIRAYEQVLDTLRESEQFKPRVFPDQTLPALSETWQRILAFIGSKESGGASIDEVENFIATNNLEVTRNNIRSQLSNYNSRGILSRVAMSQYELTNMGMLSLSAAHRAALKNKMTGSLTRLNRNEINHYNLRPIRQSQNAVPDPISNQMEHLLRETPVHKHGRPIDDD